MNCLVCGLTAAWGIFSQATGVAVCVGCRDARHERDRCRAELDSLRQVVVELGVDLQQMLDTERGLG